MKSLGLVFPGQGSQSVGMLRDIAKEFSEVNETFAEASFVLDYDLWQLIQGGPEEELNKTIHAQPALLTASYAIWRILEKKKIIPILLAGHSLGEYSALVCANAFTFTDAVRLVALRGQYMQAAVPMGQGALAAIIGLEDEVVQSLCEKAAVNEVVAPANFNSPKQVVIAGHLPAVLRVMTLAKEAGATLVKQLSVSVPSHCSLMKPAAKELAALLAEISIKKPTIPVMNNVDVKIYTDENSIRDGLVRQLFMPVRWVEIIRAFEKRGIHSIIECGPGKVLSGLNKRIVSDVSLANTADMTNLKMLLSEGSL
ncbi:MAG: hypothetical protein ACD_60C00017G0001 [uncultured bacterium]|nr:MAG: hypothetical protein ACD_60C00017G0001 [uncultured bacterium]